ncbi:ArnT family glycosyltransferase [Thiobacter aerophilum]|uniref:Glycosyltransferase family 39 protein n=1 Tax=Thiobacter aerophilum TaxID=3121275 RepID=A0ABV0EI96_9BURK
MSGADLRLARAFHWVLGLGLLLKLVLAAVAPMSGDEAYFLIWGREPALGYYDHPPMVGWLLALMLPFSEAGWVLRLPAVLASLLVGYGIFHLLRDVNREKAYLAALLYLVAPTSLLNVIITTDSGLIVWSFLSAALLWRGEQSKRPADYFWAGIFLGLAWLSKYFAALLTLAYLVHWLLGPHDASRHRRFLLLLLAAMPFIALNVYWNYGHCWANIMFNVFNRHGDAGFAIERPLIYLALLIYLFTPPLLIALWRARKHFTSAKARYFGLCTAVPFGVFGLLSFVKLIGLHWVLSFYPFFFIFAALVLEASALRRALKFMMVLTGLHLLAILVFALLPLQAFERWSKYDGMVFMLRPQTILAELAPYEDRYVFATDGYSASAIIAYHAKRPFIVFGEASSHARHDDIVTDFRALDGKNILILLKKEPEFDKFGPYFRRVSFQNFSVEGARFYLVLGEGFDYPRYREQVLRPIKEKYYAVPRFLPMGGCYFCEKYFPKEACRAAHR